MFNLKQNKEIKKIITGTKNLLSVCKTLEDMQKSFDFIFERISNKDDDKYKNLFNVDKIFNSKTLKQWKYAFDTTNMMILEFVKYKEAPNELLIIFNSFSQQQQMIIDFYILKGDK